MSAQVYGSGSNGSGNPRCVIPVGGTLPPHPSNGEWKYIKDVTLDPNIPLIGLNSSAAIAGIGAQGHHIFEATIKIDISE